MLSPFYKHFSRLLSVGLLALAICQPLAAEVYKWRDSNGILHFSNRPPKDLSAQRHKPRASSNIASPDLSGVSYSSAKSNSQQLAVVMYGTSWCGYCAKARKYFKAKGISYVEYDVEKSKARMREFKRLGGTGYPLIVIAGAELTQGFSASRFEQAYQTAKAKR